MRDAASEYAALVAARRACRACTGLRNPNDIERGTYDTHGHIGPWSTWQGRLDSPLIVVGQDYSDVAFFEKWRGGDDPKNRTNLNLIKLLCSIGIDIEPPGTPEGRQSVFLTNAILCLKSGGMGANVKNAWFRECGERFLRKQIEVLPAKVVVGLGQRAYDAILGSFGYPAQPLRHAVTLPGTLLPNGATAIAVYHCSPKVINTTRGLERQVEDWRRVKAGLRPSCR